MDSLQLVSFVFGAFLLILGMGLYSLGCDTAIEPIGGHIGAKITESRKIWLILIVCLILGVIVTIAEPDLSVLAAQVDGMIGKWELILAVAFGVGLFMIVSVLRTVLKISLNYVLIFFYGVLFLLAAFSDAGFIPLAFDSGGVTTGPITVPFIMALGVGISAVLGGKNSQDNSFGMIGICSIGPIIAVLILGLVNDASSLEYTLSVPETFSTFGEVMRCYAESLPHYLGEVGDRARSHRRLFPDLSDIRPQAACPSAFENHNRYSVYLYRTFYLSYRRERRIYAGRGSISAALWQKSAAG